MNTLLRLGRLVVALSLLMLALALLGRSAITPSDPQRSQAAALFNPGDWPMYGHNPSRTNYNPDEQIISASNVDQLVSRWQSPDLGTSGTGSSSAPSVANGKVYVGSSAPQGDNYFAFDAVTGVPTWSANLGFREECYNVGIGSTASISGDLLVVGGGDAAYYGLDANTGALRWRHALDAGPSAFAWTSPLIANDRIYVGIASYCDNPSVRGELRALDRSGSLLASQHFVPADKAGAGIWNSASVSPDCRTLALATGEDFGGYEGPYNRAIVSLDPITLEIRQSGQQGQLDIDADFGTTPIIFHDNLNRILVGANHKDGTFYTYALDNISAGPVWSRVMGVQIGMMPAYDPTFGNGGTLFVQGRNASLYAVNPATGNNRWPEVHADGRGNMAVANGLIFLNENGSLRILDETNGQTLRVITPENPGDSNSGVAVANGFVYWVSGSHLNAWSLPADVATPTPRSRTPVPVPTVAVPGADSRLFPETNRTVSGLFLDYWDSHGGLPQQGYPISEVIGEVSDMDDKPYTVQYFERAVFEYHPENQAPYNVLLSQLGTFQYKKNYPNGAPDQQPNTSEGSVLFKETGKRLGGRFLEYWQSHGGLLQQGYPISDEFQEWSPLDGKTYLVQYFERAVFELHPENQPPYDVLLSQLGTFRYREKYGAK